MRIGHARRVVVRMRRRLGARWRRSLTLRVATMTFVLSGVVVALLGIVLLHQVAKGVLDARVRSATSEMRVGLQAADAQFSAAGSTDPASVERTVDAIIFEIAPRTPSDPTSLSGQSDPYDVALLSTAPDVAGRVTGQVATDSVPARLRAAVETTGGTEYTYTRLRYTTGGSEPALVVGASLAGSAPGQYELYYLFPLRREVQTISLVQRTELFSGLLLVGLLVAIAALVTRQVVSPVRLAARGAERLAAGRLEERLPIRGEDDLARLASSFNRMAVNLQRQIGRLEELSRVQRRFVADVSHELRTPLTTVRMAADVLHGARDGFAPAAARSAELLLGQLDRFESLLADLLEISRHDAGVVVLEPEPVDLTGIVRRVVEATDPLAARRGCVVRVAAPEHPVVAEVDPRRVERVLRNLLVNALEHGEGRPVDVTVRGGPTSVAIAVRDRGVGLRPGEAALVFNRFWRADPARARSSGGSGLGLSISLEDTRLHGGWLQAWGRPGQGAQFRLTLPRRAGGELTDSPLALDPDELAPAAAVAASRSGPTAEPGAGPEPSP